MDPYGNKRHSFGPFQDEIAAQRVKLFFEQLETGSAALTKGQKRTEAFEADLQSKFVILNRTAKSDR